MGKPNRIREWRERKDLSQDQLSERAGISISYLSRMERGDRNVSLKNLEKLSEALGVPGRELISEDDRVVPLVGYVSRN